MAEQKDIPQRVIEVIADQLAKEVDEVKLESDLTEDLGADSLDATELIMNIEETFDISIPEEEAREAQTVQQIVALVEKMLAQSD